MHTSANDNIVIMLNACFYGNLLVSQCVLITKQPLILYNFSQNTGSTLSCGLNVITINVYTRHAN